MADLREQHTEIFEPEPDGKTPVTVRGFDWYDDTSAEDYLVFSLLLEQFAADLLANYSSAILPRFLKLYRNTSSVLLSDDVTAMLASLLGPGGSEWLENPVYFLQITETHVRGCREDFLATCRSHPLSNLWLFPGRFLRFGHRGLASLLSLA